MELYRDNSSDTSSVQHATYVYFWTNIPRNIAVDIQNTHFSFPYKFLVLCILYLVIHFFYNVLRSFAIDRTFIHDVYIFKYIFYGIRWRSPTRGTYFLFIFMYFYFPFWWSTLEVETSSQSVNDQKGCVLCHTKYQYTLRMLRRQGCSIYVQKKIIYFELILFCRLHFN